MSFLGRLFGRSKKEKTDEEAGKGDATKKDDEKKDGEDKPGLANRFADEAATRFVDFFGNKKPPTKEEKEKMAKEKAEKNSWRNIAATAFTYAVFIYCFCIQVWIISRSVEASKTDPNTVLINGLGAYTSSFPIGTYTQTRTLLATDLDGEYTSIVSKITITRSSTTVVQPKNTAASTQTYTSTALSIETAASARPTSTPKPSSKPAKADDEDDEDEEPADDEITWLRKRALNNQGPFTNLSTSCLYYNGSELAKRGGVAVALNVFYNVWIMVFIVILLFYERKRLRFSRKAHSAAVVGSVQIWLATDFLSRGVENTLVIAAAGVYICAGINLLYGLPATTLHREALFPYLLARPDRVGPAVRAVQYAAPKDTSQMFTSAKEAAEALDIEPEALAEPDFQPTYQPTAALVNPGLTAHMTEEERKKVGGEISPEVEKLIPGGLRSAAHLTSRSNMQELFREMLLPGKDGSGGGGGGAGSRMENVMSAMMVMNLLNQVQSGQGMFGGMGGPTMGMGQPNPMMGGPMAMPSRVGMPGGPMMPQPAYVPGGAMPYGAMGGYAAPGMAPMTGMGATAGGDDFLDRYVAKQQMKQAERQMRGWGGGGYI